MINYKLTERGKFTLRDFDEKIKGAITTISKKIKIEKLISKKVRHSYNQEYIINSEELFGTYITIELSNEEKIFGYINCFFDDKKEFIELSSSSLK